MEMRFGWEGDEERKLRPNCFLFRPIKIQFSQNMKKMGEKKGKMRVGRNYHSPPLSQLFVFFFILYFPVFFFLFYFFFLVDKISSCLHFAQYVHIGSFCLFLYVLIFFLSFWHLLIL